MTKTISRKIIGGVLGTAFVVAAFFGAHLAMNMDPHGVMRDCPLFGHVEKVCTMTVAEHIAQWQQLFTATVQSRTFLFTTLLLMSFSFLAFSFRFFIRNQLLFQTLRSRAGPPDYSSGFLLRALSSGVLRKRE